MYTIKPKFEYEKDIGIATCTIKCENQEVIGTAKCHPEDQEFMSSITGCYIAECRAVVKALKLFKSAELIPSLKALEHYHSYLKQSKQCNKDSYEYKSLCKEIDRIKKEIRLIDIDIKQEKQYLEDYLKNKDIIHNKIRKVKKQ